jgi:membrane-associated protease RseP (regulator of RpoE activity)
MGQIEIFRIGRIPIYLDFFFVLLAALWTWSYWTSANMQMVSAGFVLAIGLFLSVLLHELGHAWTARWFGIGTRSIELNGLGGLCHFDRSLPAGVLARTVIGLAGPFANLLLWQGFEATGRFFAGSGAGLFLEVMFTLAWVNLLLLIFNLLPAYPLDGGRVLEAWLHPIAGATWSTRIVAVLGLGVALWIGFRAFPGGLFLLLLAVLLAMHNWQMLQSAGGFRRS